MVYSYDDNNLKKSSNSILSKSALGTGILALGIAGALVFGSKGLEKKVDLNDSNISKLEDVITNNRYKLDINSDGKSDDIFLSGGHYFKENDNNFKDLGECPYVISNVLKGISKGKKYGSSEQLETFLNGSLQYIDLNRNDSGKYIGDKEIKRIIKIYESKK